jgi:hypothetical protein
MRCAVADLHILEGGKSAAVSKPSLEDLVRDDVALKPGFESALANIEATQSPAIPQGELVEPDIADLTDDELVARRAQIAEELAHVKELLGGFLLGCEMEIERRIRASGGRAMPHPKYEIELVEEFGPYVYDFDLLNAAAKLLPNNERAKVVKHVPEWTETHAAHDEVGAAVSISALIRKYGEISEVGILLRDAMKREKTGERLKIKERKAALPPGGTARGSVR